MAHGDPRPPPPPTEAREVKNEISPKVTEWPPHAIRGTTVALLVALMILKSSQALWSNSERFLFVSPQASVVVPRAEGLCWVALGQHVHRCLEGDQDPNQCFRMTNWDALGKLWGQTWLGLAIWDHLEAVAHGEPRPPPPPRGTTTEA